jgi:hypothetical protein
MTRSTLFTSSVLAVGFAAGLLVLPSAGISQTQTQTQPLAPRETAVAPEVNPAGDMPDNQVFISFTAPSGIMMQIPEGWARSEAGGVTSFVDKLGQIDFTSATVAQAPTPDSIRQIEVAALIATGHAVDVTNIRAMTLPVGDVIAVDYQSNSAVNPVTNRQIRLENRRIYVFRNGQEAIVTLSAPAGADNVDAWNLMANSLRWAQ